MQRAVISLFAPLLHPLSPPSFLLHSTPCGTSHHTLSIPLILSQLYVPNSFLFYPSSTIFLSPFIRSDSETALLYKLQLLSSLLKLIRTNLQSNPASLLITAHSFKQSINMIFQLSSMYVSFNFIFHHVLSS